MVSSLHTQTLTLSHHSLRWPKGIVSDKPLQQHLQPESEQMGEINIQYPLIKRVKEDLAETNWISLSEPSLPHPPGS